MYLRFIQEIYKVPQSKEKTHFLRHLFKLSDTCRMSVIRVLDTESQSDKAKQSYFLGTLD